MILTQQRFWRDEEEAGTIVAVPALTTFVFVGFEYDVREHNLRFCMPYLLMRDVSVVLLFKSGLTEDSARRQRWRTFAGASGLVIIIIH